MNSSQTQTRKLTSLAILSAVAYTLMMVGRVPVVLFLKYDPKDIVITFAGLIYGPLSSFIVSFVVSLVEFATVSDTGPIGLIMNVVSTVSFACVATVIYKRRQDRVGLTIGLVAGWLISTAVMMLWNYLITPIYMHIPRDQVAALLVPAFLPFNLLKGGLNASFIMLLYNPLMNALRRARLIPEPDETAVTTSRRFGIGTALASVLVITSCVLYILVKQKII